MNTNQLANELDLDYKTTQHHLELLTDNDVLTTMGEEYGKVFFLTDRMEDNLDVLDEIAAKTDLEIGVGDGTGDSEGHEADAAAERGGDDG